MRFNQFLDFRPISKKSVLVLLCVSAIVFSLSLLIYVRIQQVFVGYSIAEREASVLELEERFRQLKLEREVLMRPERIQKIATEHFNMRYSHE